MVLYNSFIETHKKIKWNEEMPSFRRIDIGLACPFEATVQTKSDIIDKIKIHVRKNHDIKIISTNMMDKIHDVIKPWKNYF
jgi:predicted small metal-binding protein